MTQAETHTLLIQKYDGNLSLITKLNTLINAYSELFYAVIVHGSVATNEVIPYSDFDGLLIVKDEFANSPKLEEFKQKSMALILRFDPLQHHNWFQILESQLLNYPEHYLPKAILEHSKLLYPFSNSINLELTIKQSPDYQTGLVNMVKQLENKITSKWRPKNSYELKSLLSQIMLVPCMFYSAKHQEGIFKRESFDAVRANFSEEEWHVIDIASEVRSDWNPKLNSIQRSLLQITNPFLRKIVLKLIPFHIPPKHKALVNEAFYHSLSLFLNKIKALTQ